MLHLEFDQWMLVATALSVAAAFAGVAAFIGCILVRAEMRAHLAAEDAQRERRRAFERSPAVIWRF